MTKFHEKFVCKICEKEYKTKNSLKVHKSKFHSNAFYSKNGCQIIKNVYENDICKSVISRITSVSQMSAMRQPNVSQVSRVSLKEQNTCEFCGKNYKHRQSKFKHQKKCKEVYLEKNKLDLNFIEKKKELEDLKREMLDLLNKNYKMHPKKFQKIQNQLNGDINITNNINIVPFGFEELGCTLSNKEQIEVIKKKYDSLRYLTELVHFNDKYPQFQNIVITNCQNNIAYMFDKNEKGFKVISKQELIWNIINERTSDIKDFINFQDEFISDKDKKITSKFIKSILGSEDNNFEINKELFNEEYNKIKFMIYNKSKKKDLKKLLNN